MVYVRLDAEWTDDNGVTHGAGEIVDVDPVTLVNLEARGIVGNLDKGRAGTGKESTAWAGPTSEPRTIPTSSRP
jgi:hypothetical protein